MPQLPSISSELGTCEAGLRSLSRGRRFAPVIHRCAQLFHCGTAGLVTLAGGPKPRLLREHHMAFRVAERSSGRGEKALLWRQKLPASRALHQPAVVTAAALGCRYAQCGTECARPRPGALSFRVDIGAEHLDDEVTTSPLHAHVTRHRQVTSRRWSQTALRVTRAPSRPPETSGRRLAHRRAKVKT